MKQGISGPLGYTLDISGPSEYTLGTSEPPGYILAYLGQLQQGKANSEHSDLCYIYGGWGATLGGGGRLNSQRETNDMGQ